MAIDPKKAQDVWKDIGEHVQFTVLKLKREDQAHELEVIREFCDRYQAIIRSLKIRDSNPQAESRLKVTFGFSNAAWDYLFPNGPKPKELETYTELKGPKYKMPASEGDLFFHIRASNEAVVYEAQTQFMRFLRDITEVVDETKGFRYFEGRAIIGFIDVVFGAPLALAALGNGRLHNLVVQAIRLEYQPFGHEDFRFDPCPQQLFGRHAVVAEKSAGGERRSAQDTHPAHLLCADDGSQAKIKAHRRAKRQQ